MSTTNLSELLSLLSPFRARMRWRGGLAFGQRSLWLAGLAAALIALAGRIWPLEGTRVWAWAPLGAWLLASLGAWLLRPYPALRVALAVDRELGLKERVSTSLAFQQEAVDPEGRAFDPRLVRQMETDALETLRIANTGQAFRPHFERRLVGLGVGLVVLTALLAFLPNPMDAVVAERKAAAQAAREQAVKIEKLKEEVEKSAELSAEEKEKLRQLLDELAKKLQSNPGDRPQALADLNKAEQALRDRLDANAAAQKAALDAIAAKLQALAGLEKNERLGDWEKAAEDLQKLADSLANLTPEQREALAAQLGQLAARAAQAGNTSLAQALAGLAQAARSGDSSAASQAAQAGQQAIQQAQAQQASQAATQRVLSGVQSSRQAMAGQAASSGGSGQNQGQGQGQSGQGTGQGRGTGQQAGGGGGGSNANQLPGQQGSGQMGRPNSSGQTAGEGEMPQVYVPREKRPSGGSELTIPGQDSGQGQEQTSQSPVPLPGSNNPALVPYTSVFPSYRDAAGQALEQSAIPADMKEFVRQYFSQLEP